MGEEYNEFLKKIKKVTGKRNHKITNSLGVKDAYIYYRKNRPKEKKFVIIEKDYFNIIRSINNIVAQQVAKGVELKLPYRFGSLLVEQRKLEPKLDENGKLIYRAPIDWDATLKLWYENAEDKENKTLVKTEQRTIYKITYSKKKAKYTNEGFVIFSPNRELKKQVQKETINGYITQKFT